MEIVSSNLITKLYFIYNLKRVNNNIYLILTFYISFVLTLILLKCLSNTKSDTKYVYSEG